MTRIYTRTMADFEQALNDAGTERPELTSDGYQNSMNPTTLAAVTEQWSQCLQDHHTISCSTERGWHANACLTCRRIHYIDSGD